jgi:Antibiotic biosynthesis monooxygenase
MFIVLAVHHPKGPDEKARLMAAQPSLAKVNSKHKGFIQMIVAEVEDENLIVPFTLWESEEDYMAARADAVSLLFSPATISFLTSVQEGPTRSGGASISRDTVTATFKVRPVQRPQQKPFSAELRVGIPGPASE